MSAAKEVARIEQSIEIEASPATVFDVLTDPCYVPEYAAGIEGAEILDGDGENIQGAKLEMLTSRGNLLRATVLECKPPKRLVIEDERGTRSTWTVTQGADGKVRLTNVLEGAISPARADKLQYDADVKLQALARKIELGEAEGHGHHAKPTKPTA